VCVIAVFAQYPAGFFEQHESRPFSNGFFISADYTNNLPFSDCFWYPEINIKFFEKLFQYFESFFVAEAKFLLDDVCSDNSDCDGLPVQEFIIACRFYSVPDSMAVVEDSSFIFFIRVVLDDDGLYLAVFSSDVFKRFVFSGKNIIEIILQVSLIIFFCNQGVFDRLDQSCIELSVIECF
jgi:hypothetical protein